MKDYVFLGVFAAHPSASNLGIGTDGAVFWQVWQSSSQEIFIQGTDADGVKIGSVFEILQEDLLEHFTSVQEDTGLFEVSTLEFAESIYSASDPLLLEYWLKIAEERQKTPPQPLEVGAGVQDTQETQTVEQKNANNTSEEIDNTLGRQINSPCEFLPEDEEQVCLFEEVMRSEFFLLLDKWRMEPNVQNMQLLKDMVYVEGNFTKRQKLMFTEFGLALRKNGLHELALACHQRALELDASNARILFNIARSQSELGQIIEAQQSLQKALEIDPEFKQAQTFLEFLQGLAG